MSKILKNRLIASLIFIFLIVTSVFFVKPVYNKVNKTINDITKEISRILVEQAGIKVKYKSLSPSILSSFTVNEIQVFDKNEALILEINRTKINYNLKNIFSGNVNRIVKSVAIDGIQVSGNELENYVTELTAKYSNSESEENEESLKIEELLEQIEKFIPQFVSVKKFTADYENDFISAMADLKKINFSFNNKKNVFEISADGNADAKLVQNNLEFSTDFSLNSSLFPENHLSGSNISLKIENFTNGEFYLNTTGLQITASENQINVASNQNPYPLSFDFGYDLNKKTVSGGVDMNNFTPSQLLSLDKKQKKNLFAFAEKLINPEKVQKTEEIENQVVNIYSKIKDMKLNLSLHGDYDFNDSRIAYNSSGTVDLPEELIPGNFKAEYSFFGNDKKIQVPSLNLQGNNCYLNAANLDFTFDGMIVEGILEVPYYNLPNGNSISTEVFIETVRSGYMLIAPSLFIGDTVLTGLQLDVIPQKDSLDFKVEISDYSHFDANDDAGIVRLEGSYLFDSQYFQSSLEITNLFCDSIAQIAASVLPEQLASTVINQIPLVSPYVLRTDGFVSSDLHSISYNFPAIILAGTTKDSFNLFMSANGNEQSIQLDILNFIYKKQNFTASLSLDRMPDSSDMFFLCDFTYGSVPYHLSGSVMPEMISVSGNYGMDMQFHFNKKNFDGHLNFDNLPIKIANASLAFSMNTDFQFTEQEGPTVQISRLVLEETGSMFKTNPVISMEGNVTKYGAQFSSISFSDQFSTLEGYSDISLNIFDKKFDSAGMNFYIKNPFSNEVITSNIILTTQDGEIKNLETLLNSLYVDCQLQLSNFSLNRFSTVKNDDNEIDMTAYMTGPVGHPSVTLNVEKISMMMGGIMTRAQGLAFIEDRNLLVDDFILDFQGMVVKDISAEISLEDFKGKADATFFAEVMGRTANIPLHLDITDTVLEKDKFIPSQMNAVLSSNGMSGSLINKPVDISLFVMYLNNSIILNSSENIGLFGVFSSDGQIKLSMNSENFAKMEASGHIKKDDISIRFSNLNFNLKELIKYLNLEDLIQLNSGELKGSFIYSENPDGPEFKGALSIVNPSLQIPLVVPYDVTSDRIMILMNGNEIHLAETTYKIKNKHNFKFSTVFFLNKWILDHAEISIFTLEKDYIPIKINQSLFDLNAEIGCNLKIILDNMDCDITGSVLCENLLLKSSIADVTRKREKADEKTEISNQNAETENSFANSMNVHMDVGLKLGSHTMINFDPILRCIFAPNTSVRFLADLEENLYEIRGNLGIKSGDIQYLNKNFYIKEGNIRFNSGDIFNPTITIKAETREKDDRGENIRIIISAENQLLMNFEPKFTSIPSKPENEIRMLLGQVIVGGQSVLNDNAKNGLEFAKAAGDYALQSVVFRGVENKLRNLMNIDIFSVRTNIIQNIPTDRPEYFSAKQLLDNSSLYMGRYFGDMIYFDAMVNLSYKDNFGFSSNAMDGLQILPEFGIELELPGMNFPSTSNLNVSSNLRWSMAPDFSAMLKGEFLPSSSVTLSWKFSF